MSCMHFTRLCRTLSFTAISTLITLVPVAAGALEPEKARDIVIMLDKNPLVAIEAACTAVTAARVLKTYQYTDDTGDHVVHNNVTLLPVLDGVNLGRAAVLNSPLLNKNKWHKCNVPGSFVDSTEELAQVTLKENLEGFLQCDIDTVKWTPNFGQADKLRSASESNHNAEVVSHAKETKSPQSGV